MILVPRDRLPSDSGARYGALRDYFCDKDATATLTPDGWSLELAWPDGAERHVDPQLPAGLAWWGDGVRLETMALATKRQGRLYRALYDTWTLYSWSEWLARRGPDALEDLTILHVDDHRDLGSPRLFQDGDAWIDPIAGEVCDLSRPSSVKAAILSGALGMGSFLTPFLHLVPRADVRHLCQPPKAIGTTDYRTRLTTTPDSLLSPERIRPAVDLEPAPGATGPGCYRITPDLDAWLEDLGPGPILLHIDMDYFNNRYDCDSDWQERPAVLDPPADQVRCKIDEMIGALSKAGATDRLEDVVIAFSPGFFPAELWAEADARLAEALG